MAFLGINVRWLRVRVCDLREVLRMPSQGTHNNSKNKSECVFEKIPTDKTKIFLKIHMKLGANFGLNSRRLRYTLWDFRIFFLGFKDSYQQSLTILTLHSNKLNEEIIYTVS